MIIGDMILEQMEFTYDSVWNVVATSERRNEGRSS